MEQHSSQEVDSQEEVGTERIQAFSDGVFAVAITLLILDIHVPALEETKGDALALLSGMAQLWPHYLSFFISFLFVGTIWSNHHTMFSYIKRSNQVLILLNLLLLLCMVVVAFTAGLLGLYIKQPAQWVAILIYNGVLVMCCVCYNALWWYAAKGARLLAPTLHPEVVRQTTLRYAWSPFLYLLAFFLSFPLFWNGTPGLVLCILLAIVYLLPVIADRVKVKRR